MQASQKSLFLKILQSATGKTEEILSTAPVGGGDINQAARVETRQGTWFLKWNDAHAFPGMFEAEAKGLKLLGQTEEITVPEVIGHADGGSLSMLVLRFIKPAPQKPHFWRMFGEQLTRMHRHTSDQFGLGHPNYIGSLPQMNHPKPEWTEFFISCRLEEQIRMARDNHRIDSGTIKAFERLYLRLEDFFPPEPPSLVHGDLWSGNYMAGQQGEPCIIDPAVYYGHRLMDIGMSRLFGGFADAFYEGIHETWPLESNWREACDIANLYPLMVHVNLFGGGYMGSVKGILRAF